LQKNDNRYYIFHGLSQFVFVLSVLFTTHIVVSKFENRKFADKNLTVNAKSIFRGFLLGEILMIAFVLLVLATNTIRLSYIGISWHLIFGFGLYFLVSVSEEIMVRGYILSNLKEKFSPLNAVLISSLIFGFLHILNDDFGWIGFINISLSGILFGMLCLKQNSISGPIGLHWAWNFFQGPLLGFSVSGRYEKGVFDVGPITSTLFTGGNFGAEGSILLIPITCIFIYLVWNSKYFGLKS
jgi:uncharacterized protein